MYPSTIYRLVAKALITNENGEVLAVKEGGDFWSLPGGGVEHGESTETTLIRELSEEIGVTDIRVGDIVHVTTAHHD